MIQYIIKELKLSNEDVAYCAYTGKACQVLKEKGNNNTMTLHKLLYKCEMEPNGKCTFIKKATIPYKVVVVDECSMLTKEMINDLASYPNVHYLFLGDPFQLEPVGDKPNQLLDNPHIFLTEIMRQSLDNEIVKFSLDIREGRELPAKYDGKTVSIHRRDELTGQMLLDADVVLCATNSTRVKINNKLRELNNRTGAPVVGDKVICLKNNWNIYDTESNALVNGTTGTIWDITEKYSYSLPKYICTSSNTKFKYYLASIKSDTGGVFYVALDKALFEGTNATLTPRQEYQLTYYNKSSKRKITIPEKFTYGYCMTTHKTQGSQFNKVLIIEESFPFEGIEHQKWLYTSLTRAIDSAVIIRNI